MNSGWRWSRRAPRRRRTRSSSTRLAANTPRATPSESPCRRCRRGSSLERHRKPPERKQDSTLWRSSAALSSGSGTLLLGPAAALTLAAAWSSLLAALRAPAADRRSDLVGPGPPLGPALRASSALRRALSRGRPCQSRREQGDRKASSSSRHRTHAELHGKPRLGPNVPACDDGATRPSLSRPLASGVAGIHRQHGRVDSDPAQRQLVLEIQCRVEDQLGIGWAVEPAICLNLALQ